MFTRSVLSFALLALPGTAFAQQSKEAACGLQGEIVASIQQARLDRVSKDNVVATVLADNPEWPASVENAMPPLVAWIYDQRRRDLKKVNLSDTVKTQCLENWDQLQSLSQSGSN